jgi:N-acetylglutamate synthase-like GNAT family acetyltransferase
MDPEGVIIKITGENEEKFACQIAEDTDRLALARGSGISKHSPESIIRKMRDGKAVVAITNEGQWAGFSYIEVWANGEFVSNSGLIVAPAHQGSGISRTIKEKIFKLSRKFYPLSKIFSITTGLAIMKMNAQLGFEPVNFNEIVKEKKFWQGCKSCVNYSILQSKSCKNCLCTAMLFVPVREKNEREKHSINLH